MELYRTERITLKGKKDSFSVTISNTSDKPTEWTIVLIDYDNNVGCIGLFASEAEALAHVDAWFVIAKQEYASKHAKYGRMPVVKLHEGELVVEYEGERY